MNNQVDYATDHLKGIKALQGSNGQSLEDDLYVLNNPEHRQDTNQGKKAE